MATTKDRILQFSVVNAQMNLGDMLSVKIGGKHVVSAFRDPILRQINSGTKLYRFNPLPYLTEYNGLVSGWWGPYDEEKEMGHDIYPGWNATVNMARCFGVSVRELGRITSAITESWNSCEFLIVIQLKLHVKAAYGRFRQQLRRDNNPSKVITGRAHWTESGGNWHRDGILNSTNAEYAGPVKPENRSNNTLNLPGGGRQFYIPNFKREHFEIITVENLVNR
jgi:hypothetical protein